MLSYRYRLNMLEWSPLVQRSRSYVQNSEVALYNCPCMYAKLPTLKLLKCKIYFYILHSIHAKQARFWPWPVPSANRCCGAWWRRPRFLRPVPAPLGHSRHSTARTSPSAARPGLASPAHTKAKQIRKQAVQSQSQCSDCTEQFCYCMWLLPRNQSWGPWLWWGSQRKLPISWGLLEHMTKWVSRGIKQHPRQGNREGRSIPYLSRKRNTNVSVMVMRTPAQSGILTEERRHEACGGTAIMCYKNLNL